MAVLEGEAPPAPLRVIPVKFLAGTLAIGARLALAREGPSVQMGASIAYQTGRLLRRSWADCRMLLAAGAGAGFATAFNAPIAGATFVLEALLRRFEARIAIAALAASAVAIWVGQVITGNAPDYTVGPGRVRGSDTRAGGARPELDPGVSDRGYTISEVPSGHGRPAQLLDELGRWDLAADSMLACQFADRNAGLLLVNHRRPRLPAAWRIAPCAMLLSWPLLQANLYE
jgi:hypothetical protein